MVSTWVAAALLAAVLFMELKIMSAVSDYAAKQAAFNQKISDDLDTLAADITALNAQIAAFNNSPGTLSASDQAALDGLVSTGAALQSKADALSAVAPPAIPPAVTNG